MQLLTNRRPTAGSYYTSQCLLLLGTLAVIASMSHSSSVGRQSSLSSGEDTDTQRPSSTSSSSISSSTSSNNNQSPFSIYYWFGERNVNEAISVLFPGMEQDPLVCSTSEERGQFKTGLCLRMADCPYHGGSSGGSCGGGMGTCCVFSYACSSTTNVMVSQFTNYEFDDNSFGVGECKLTVKPRHYNICQYRLDFEDFVIAQPDKNSDCTQDFLGVRGGSNVPKLCGTLTGQHLYVNVQPGAGPIVITVDTSKVYRMKRRWNIKVTQIDCNSPYRAPMGCLQFFNETSGIVKSFNFSPAEDIPTVDGRQIQKLNYGICINSKVGYCDLTWSKSPADGDHAFSITGDGTANRNALISEFGVENCAKDFITIPGGVFVDQTGADIHAVRFCGTDLPEVKTKSQPYLLHVTTDRDEEGDLRNRGFALSFRQNLC